MGWFHCQVPRHDQNICSRLCHSAVACWAQRLEELFNFRSVSWHRWLWFLQISLAMIISRRMMENACTQSSRWMLAWWHIYIYLIIIYNYITIIYIYIYMIIYIIIWSLTISYSCWQTMTGDLGQFLWQILLGLSDFSFWWVQGSPNIVG